MSRMHRDRLLGVIVAIFATIFLMTNTYGRELPELFLQGFAIALFGFMVLVAITLLRWRLVYRLSASGRSFS
jgi:hypothetical protein